MCNWYKHDIPAWLGGTANLSHEAYRLYHIVCQLIYMHERPIVLNERGLAGAAAMSTRAFRTALKELLDAEKLVQIGHKLSNVRASFELEKVAKSREHSTKSREPSTKSREQAPNLLKTNGTAQVIPIVPSPRLEEKRLEQSKKDAADAAPEVQEAPDARVYARGREVLGKGAGGLIKKLITAKEGNLALAMAAIETASTKHQPREYIGKIIAGQGDRYDDLCPRTFSSFTVR